MRRVASAGGSVFCMRCDTAAVPKPDLALGPATPAAATVNVAGVDRDGVMERATGIEPV